MRRGPKPQPTNLRLLQGGTARPTDDQEPRPTLPTVLPDPPDYLTGYALGEWERVMPDLFGTGVYAEIDQTMLAAYCMSFGRWIQAELDLDKMAKLDQVTHGLMMKTSNGNAIQNPLVGAAASARRDMHRLADSFGLTPSSRTQIQTGKGGEDSRVANKYGLT